MSEQPQRPQPEQQRLVQVSGGQLRQFRLDNPDARLVSWPYHANQPLVYGFMVKIEG